MKLHLIIIGIILLTIGLYSIYSGIKGKRFRGYMSPSDKFIVKKVFGDKGSNYIFNIFWGIIEIIFGILILLGKFN